MTVKGCETSIEDKIDEDLFWIADELRLTGLGLLVNTLYVCRALHYLSFVLY